MFASLLAVAATLSTLVVVSQAALDLTFGDDADLTSFVTRPEIKTPKFNISVYDADKIAPGYWFLAPYAMIFQEKHANKYYQPCQTGPSIFDSRGELVWSGACRVRNQNTCDFRAWEFNNSLYTSAILTPFRDVSDPKGHGIIMDNSFNTIGDIHVPTTMHNFNMHELNLVENGTQAIHIVHDAIEADISVLEQNQPSAWILDSGFRELDLMTGEILFEWWASKSGVSLAESKVPFRAGMRKQNPWNWFHGNSVEKNADGDYLLSSRFTDTIYKISGKDGSILWRLGGSLSSFTQDFQFSRQHDARWLSIDGHKERISFLDNSADDRVQTANHSSARVVELDTKAMSVKAVKTITRPDNGLTRMRGNHQTLANGNSFICWSENSYISEHDSDGKIVMEAKFASLRFVTYRAYKFNYTAESNEPIAVKSLAYGPSATFSTTAIYVSWNGATEVGTWRFKNAKDDSVIGEKMKTGFETTFHGSKFESAIYVEAIARNGSVIGKSESIQTVIPVDWENESLVPELHASVETSEPQPTTEPKVHSASNHRGVLSAFISDEGMAITLFVVTVMMLCVSLWLWRCSSCGRSNIQLRSGLGYTTTVESKYCDDG